MTTTDDDVVRSFTDGGRPATPDPDVSRREEAAPTLLDELREDLAGLLPGGACVDIPVPGRPKWAVRFRKDLEFPVFSRWAKRSKDKSQAGEVDALKLACTVVANQCAAILRVAEGAERVDGCYLDEDATPLSDDDGENLTFTSPQLHDMLGATKAIDAVRAFYALDGYVIQVSGDVLDANGLGEDPSDPT